MDSEYSYRTNFRVTRKAVRPTVFPHLQINFSLSLYKEYNNFLVNFETGPRHLPLPPMHRTATTASIIVREELSFYAVRDAIAGAIGGSLSGRERGLAVLLAWEELLLTLSPLDAFPMHVELDFDVDVRGRYWYVHEEAGGEGGMVPAAEEGIRRLEECEAAREDGCCSICLEELGAALRMPCSHVFHVGCIKEWLRKSHYCPLCRYEMPTATD
ncbi:RING-type E3 ubiquitin transferase [Salvia divinorum]|uniref:RING-type E3 ubiquitin transferase n=1 Tax=Salvia divinorum TaxID=28513 RepID=A0ABD1G6Q7_SALDI